jgi:hypothetical protein
MPFLFGHPQFLLNAPFDELQDEPISIEINNNKMIFLFSFFMDQDM